MNLSNALMLILFVSLIFVCWNILIDDFEDNYVDTGISNVSKMSSNYTDKFGNYSKTMNDSFGPLIKDFQGLSSESEWFDKIVGVASIPLAILSIPIVLGEVIYQTFIDIPKIARLIGVPEAIIYFALVAITVYIIFKLVQLFKT